MPLFEEGQPLGDSQNLRMPIGSPEPDPFLHPTPNETLGAAFRQANPIVSALDAILRDRPSDTPVPGYDPIPKLIGSKYEPYIDQFLADVNPAQTDARMAKIDAEIRDRQILAVSGSTGTVDVVVAIAANPLWILLIWVVLTLWRRRIRSWFWTILGKSQLKSFNLLIISIVSFRKAWTIGCSNLRAAYRRVQHAVHEAEDAGKR